MSLQKSGGRAAASGRAASANGGTPLFYQDLNPLPVASHGEGIYIFDEQGRRYVDGCSGAISANLGHGNKRVQRAAMAQMDKIAFTYRTQFESRPANELAELLVSLCPPELSRAFFVNSGSEAVESAVKLARQYWWAKGKTGKHLIISRRPSYHGATLGALACTAYAPLNIPFVPMLADSPKVSSPFCYHCPLAKEYPACGMACAHELERAIRVHGADNVAAFIAEPIGGASTGAAVPPDEYFPIVERICHDNNILFISDDVMTGCGRTGTFFGFEHWDVTPDIIAISKGLSGGYAPIGAIIATGDIVQPVLDSGGFMHGHTYAGNPLSAAIALEVTRIILEDRLPENARRAGAVLRAELLKLQGKYSFIGDVRGRGLLLAIEFVRDRAARAPFDAKWQIGQEVTRFARGHGLLIYPRRPLDGLAGDHVLIAPPLIITETQVHELIRLLDRALGDLEVLIGNRMQSPGAGPG
ncbi:aminotransferase class III-fold pyridoxal phosphate-dependent enzyme [Candidatus Poribacteria bacterium]|nr:aminotransferase class III-fold pyridoxal phosphate-dependent enzyme [Candidatus Poribacteria bacterium]